MLSHEQQMKFLKRSLRFSNELKMSFLLNTSADSFANDLLNSALEDASGCDLWEIRSQEKFDAVSESMQMNWSDSINNLVKMVEEFAVQASDIRAVARRAKDNAVPITEHLDLLFSPGFLRRQAVISDYPRYLRALKLRAERLVNAPARDAQKGEVLEEYLDKFYAAWESVGSLVDSDGLYEFWQLLEECRIAIFAPEVKCTIKSPVAKLPDFWKNLRL